MTDVTVYMVPTLPFAKIDDALADLRQGKMLILVDLEREHEGDLMMAAEKVTPAAINFMLTHARGLLHLILPETTLQRLQIPLMPRRNEHPNQAAFTVSIEAVHGVTTGGSVQDRVQTIKVAIDPHSTPADLRLPGHVFPLQACAGGVLQRPGHTEGSMDLVCLADLQPAAILCEILSADGRMASVNDLCQFAEQHQIKLVSMSDLIATLNNMPISR